MTTGTQKTKSKKKSKTLISTGMKPLETRDFGLDEVWDDPVNHPTHYTNHPSGIECIQVTEHMSFNLGNALKYIWRCDLKHDAVEDLKKSMFYIQREIDKRENNK